MSRDEKSLLTRAVQMPWLATTGVRRLLSVPYLRLAFAVHGVAWGRRWRVFGMPVLQRHRESRIDIGDGVYLRSWSRSNPLMPNHRVVLSTRRAGAVIQIGADCGFTGTTIVADQRVQIGDRVQVGANATIVDTDFHPLTPEDRRADMYAGDSAPVTIGDDVFIGMQSIVLKGVTVGAGSVIGAGSVVASDVPPRSVVAGNPARVVRTLA